jgi:ankyrin repeat protein
MNQGRESVKYYVELGENMKNRLTKSRAIYAANRAIAVLPPHDIAQLDDDAIALYLKKEIRRMYPHLQFVSHLLQHLKPIAFSLTIDDEGNSLLHTCAWHNHVEIIQLLMNHSIGTSTIDTLNENNQTALGIALEQEAYESAELLIASGANLKMDSTPPLIAALKSNMEKTASLLIQQGCDIHAMDSGLKRTSLTWSIEKRMIHIALKLIEMGAELDHSDFNGDTALIKSCGQPACESIISALIKAGANTRIPNRDGRLPGQIAQSWVRKRHPELLGNKLLLQESYMNMLLGLRKEMEEIW